MPAKVAPPAGVSVGGGPEAGSPQVEVQAKTPSPEGEAPKEPSADQIELADTAANLPPDNALKFLAGFPVTEPATNSADSTTTLATEAPIAPSGPEPVVTAGEHSQTPQREILLADATLDQTKAFLVDGAKEALASDTFQGRNETMSAAIADESSLLAARSLGKPEAREALRQAFQQVTAEAGDLFENAFDDSGKPKPDQEGLYKGAMKDAKIAAFKNLDAVFKAAGVDVDPAALLGKVDFGDVIQFTSRNLGIETPKGFTVQEIRDSLHKSAKGDYYEGLIDKLPFREGTPLTDQEKTALDLSLRTANAAWKVGQVHRAAWEGNDSRIDPSKRGAQFNPYDLLIKEQHGIVEEAGSPDRATLRVAFEVYKDVDNLVRAVPSPAPPPTS